MIISGGSRSAWKYWARHLTRADENERVHVAEIKGLMVETVPDALREMSLMALGSRATKFLYHADINPREDERLTDKQWDQAVDTLERNLGLEGHARVVVEHEKLGRVHRHVVWSRVDPDTMTVVSDSHDWSKHQATSRELEHAFQLEPVTGVIGHDGKRRPRRPKNYETKRGRETGITPEQVGVELTALWKQADTGHAFAAALTDRGYILARGDRGFVVVDQAGTTHSLARRIDGARAADVRARMVDVDLAALPSVEEARQLAKERAAQRDHHEQKPEPQPAPDKALPDAVDRFADLLRDVMRDHDAHPAPEPLGAVEAPPPEPFADAVKDALASRDLTAAEEAAPELLPEIAGFELLALAFKRVMGGGDRNAAPEAVKASLPHGQLAPATGDAPAEPQGPVPETVPDKAPLPVADRFAQLVREAVRDRDTEATGERQEAAPASDAFDRLTTAIKRSMGIGAQNAAAPPAHLRATSPPEPDAFDHLTRAMKHAMGIGPQGTARPPAKPDALAPPAPDTFTRLCTAIKQDMRRTAVKPFTGDGLTVWERAAAIRLALQRATEWTAALVREAGGFVGRLLREEARPDRSDNGRER